MTNSPLIILQNDTNIVLLNYSSTILIPLLWQPCARSSRCFPHWLRRGHKGVEQGKKAFEELAIYTCDELREHSHSDTQKGYFDNTHSWILTSYDIASWDTKSMATVSRSTTLVHECTFRICNILIVNTADRKLKTWGGLKYLSPWRMVHIF